MRHFEERRGSRRSARCVHTFLILFFSLKAEEKEKKRRRKGEEKEKKRRRKGKEKEKKRKRKGKEKTRKAGEKTKKRKAPPLRHNPAGSGRMEPGEAAFFFSL